MKKYKLAIVIPAYKPDFLYETLNSIANQTCKDFTIYIGDDNSPNDLYRIIKEFEKILNISYTKFNNNLGRNNLPTHWERCINLTKEEEWIWLFSDDDLMEKNCVEKFYEELAFTTNIDVFHFNCHIINNQNKIIKLAKDFPKEITAIQFYERRIKGQILSFIVEYIFKKSIYLKLNKFERFPMAWCVDDAFWIKITGESKIRTISGPHIMWRLSGKNISSIKKDREIALDKIRASSEFIQWANQQQNLQPLITNSLCNDKIKWFSNQIIALRLNFSLFEGIKFIYRFYTENNCSIRSFLQNIARYIYYKIK